MGYFSFLSFSFLLSPMKHRVGVVISHNWVAGSNYVCLIWYRNLHIMHVGVSSIAWQKDELFSFLPLPLLLSFYLLDTSVLAEAISCLSAFPLQVFVSVSPSMEVISYVLRGFSFPCSCIMKSITNMSTKFFDNFLFSCKFWCKRQAWMWLNE